MKSEHAYLPRVTSILKDAGLVDTRWFTEYAREKGTQTHRAAQFIDRGGVNWATMDPGVFPRAVQYQRFLDEVNPMIHAIERPVVNVVMGYRGTLDRIVAINGRMGVLDIKGPGRFIWHPIQLSLYQHALTSMFPCRWTLHLSDKDYRLVEHRGRHDWEVAKAAITIANFINHA